MLIEIYVLIFSDLLVLNEVLKRHNKSNSFQYLEEK